MDLNWIKSVFISITAVEHPWDLPPAVQYRGICEICVSPKKQSCQLLLGFAASLCHFHELLGAALPGAFAEDGFHVGGENHLLFH